jgi:hypothetical protein
MQFDTDTLDRMGEAYDAAIRRLHMKSDNPLTSRLAAWIAALADEGERDVAVLTEKAIANLKEVEAAKS